MADEAAEVRAFYEQYYQMTAGSKANALYCQRLFGADMAQHGFAELDHLEHLMQVAGMHSDCRVLDLGCGNGKMDEFFAKRTGAYVTGIDYIPGAIEQALARTNGKSEQLDFRVMDMGNLDFPAETFDIIVSVDTLYFISLQESLPKIAACLKPGGCLVTFYNYTWQLWMPFESFDCSKVPADKTDLADMLRELAMPFETWDYTAADVEHARRKEAIALELQPLFAAEGTLELCEGHIEEARGIQEAFSKGAHGRYLYKAWRS